MLCIHSNAVRTVEYPQFGDGLTALMLCIDRLLIRCRLRWRRVVQCIRLREELRSLCEELVALGLDGGLPRIGVLRRHNHASWLIIGLWLVIIVVEVATVMFSATRAHGRSVQVSCRRVIDRECSLGSPVAQTLDAAVVLGGKTWRQQTGRVALLGVALAASWMVRRRRVEFAIGMMRRRRLECAYVGAVQRPSKVRYVRTVGAHHKAKGRRNDG